MNSLDIQEIRLYSALSDLSRPIADATHTISTIAFRVAEVISRGGDRGQGYLLSFNYSPGAIGGALKDLREFALAGGYRINETLRLARDWQAQSEYFGQEGVNACAGAALNLALWDAWARHCRVPIWQLLGTCRSRIPLYGSGGWLSYSLEELLEEVLSYKARGFGAVKIKVGSGSLERDLERLRKCREALGPGVRIMMDANQGLSLGEALELARAAEPVGITWFEEPLVNTDYEGYRILRSKCGIPLAMGEREYGPGALRRLIGLSAIDLWQPDIVRLGGVEGWKNSAALAEACHIPVLPHYYRDYDVPLLCTVGRALGAESFDWIDGIIDNPLKIADGCAFPREEAGFGFRFKDSALSELE